MNTNDQFSPYTDVGYLTVRVSTAGGAIPLENASVNIRGGDVDDSTVLYALSTNSDGLTPTVSLPTPPYAVYNIDVFANGYAPAFFHNVPIFSGINSIQPAVLLPELENQTHSNDQHVTESYTGGDGR